MNKSQAETALGTYFLPTNLIPSCFAGSFGKETLINSGKKYIFQIKDNVFIEINFTRYRMFGNFLHVPTR